jgi:hypothetical protein
VSEEKVRSARPDGWTSRMGRRMSQKSKKAYCSQNDLLILGIFIFF